MAASSFEEEAGPFLSLPTLIALRTRHALDMDLFAYATALTCRQVGYIMVVYIIIYNHVITYYYFKCIYSIDATATC